MESPSPIRPRAAEEGSIQIPLWGVPLILILLCVCLFSGLGTLGLIGPDEPRYAAIARAMAETHDWITPRLWGAPWFEKPVLYYWCAGIGMRIFGVGEFAARLPSSVAALLAIAAAIWTALRAYGLGTAWYLALMLPSCVAMIGFSRAASPDMLFAGLLTAAMAIASEMLQRARPKLAHRIAFGFFLGMAVLAKGPAAVILAAGATLLWAAVTRNWRAPLRFLHPWTLAVFFATALPWYMLCALRNPEFLGIFLWQHNFERYLTPVFQHQQPVWFYVPILILAMVPWLIMPLGSVFTRWNNDSWQDSPAVFFLCWALFPFLFFSFSESKLPGYILPAVPPLFLLMARAMDRLRQPAGGNFLSYATAITGAMFLILPLGLERLLLATGLRLNVPVINVVVLLALGGIGGVIATILSLRKEPATALAAVSLLVAALLACMNVAILPYADSRLSARSVARECFRLNPSGQNLAVYGLTRDWHYGLNYYFGRELPEWKPGAPLPEWLVTSARGALDISQRGNPIEEAGRAGAPFAVLLHVSAEGDSRR